MQITIKNYKIHPYNDYCYRLARRKGGKQWQTLGYYDYLSDAFECMLDHYVRTGKHSLKLDVDIASIKREVDGLVRAIHGYSEELKKIAKNIRKD